jgi:putative PIN family toxin of toxin-antitoxin system
MKRTELFVFDVNTLVSAFIVGSYANTKAFDLAIKKGRIVVSWQILLELTDVFLRPKFDKYVSLNSRIHFLNYLDRQLLICQNPPENIKICRDPSDNKYLDLAFSVKANCVITGDKDLLTLKSVHGIPILNATQFIELH